MKKIKSQTKAKPKLYRQENVSNFAIFVINYLRFNNTEYNLKTDRKKIKITDEGENRTL